MKRSTLFAALLCTTALAPATAEAGPVLAFAAGALANVGVFIPVAGSIGAYTAGIQVGGFLFGSSLGRTLLGVGLSALASRPNLPDFSIPEPSAQMGNFAQSVSYAQWVFGRSRKGGPLAFTQAKDSRRYYVVILAAHEIKGVIEHWLDEYTVGVDLAAEDANIITDDPYTAPSVLDGKGRIEVYTGNPGQVASATIVDAFEEITPDFDFEGLAVGVIWARKVSDGSFSQVYPRGREWAYTPVIEGNNQIYDPRDDTYKYTDNAALVIAFWLTNILGVDVDWDDVAEESNIADIDLLNKDGETVKKWTINGTLSDDQQYDDQRNALAMACDAFFFEKANGKVGFKLGRWIEPRVTLTSGDFLDCEVTEGQWGADAATEVAPKYIEPDNAWRETPAGVFVNDSTVREVRSEPNLFLVNDHNQASRVAKRLAKASRPKYQLSGSIGMIGYELIGERFFTMSHSGLGITQTFEISTLVRQGAGLFEISAISVEPSDFDFDASTEEPEKPVFDSIQSQFENPDLTGLTATPGDAASIVVSWDAQEDFLSQQIRWKTNAASQWQSAPITDGSTELVITGLIDGTIYQVQGRNASTVLLSNPSDWTPEPALEVTTVGNSTAPDNITGLSVSTVLSDVTVTWTPPNDPNYYAAQIHRSSTSDFADASIIRVEYASTGVHTYADNGLSAGTYYYWVAPVNASNVPGSVSGPEFVEIT